MGLAVMANFHRDLMAFFAMFGGMVSRHWGAVRQTLEGDTQVAMNMALPFALTILLRTGGSWHLPGSGSLQQARCS